MPPVTQFRPKLRPLSAQPLTYEGMAYIQLRDPLQLSDKTILVPQPLIPLLPLLDGTRTLLQLQVALSIHHQLRVGMSHIENLIASLDDALLLDNENYTHSRQLTLNEYQNAPFRPPALAGASYPHLPDELQLVLDGFMSEIQDPTPLPETLKIRGLISPHIDFARGGSVYAKTWQAARSAAQQAELVILLGTDHFGEGNPITFTHQSYGTPFGILPTDIELVDAAAKYIGADSAFAGELHHRQEHSLELAAVWLQHARNRQPVMLLPILCGPFETYENSKGSLRFSPMYTSLINFLRSICAERPTLVIAAGDLSHVGPAFGGNPVGVDDLAQVNHVDQNLLNHVVSGDSDALYQSVSGAGDCTNVCGTTAIYTALRILEPVAGQVLAYTACPADTSQTSFVTIAGAVLR